MHDPSYVGLVERVCDALPEYYVAELPTGDATVVHDSFRIALLAAGAAVDAARRARPDRPMFAMVRPHAYPAYPGTGAFSESRKSDNGFIIDVPLDLNTTTHDFIGVWSMLLPALAARIKPKTIVVSTGFDFLEGDPIAGLPVHVEAVDALCGLLGETAADHKAGLAFVLEGGYSLPNLRASGRSLAHSFGAGENRAHVPKGQMPRDTRLREMIKTALS